MTDFRTLGVSEAVCDGLAARGIAHPFQIQALVIPEALAGGDVLAKSQRQRFIHVPVMADVLLAPHVSDPRIVESGNHLRRRLEYRLATHQLCLKTNDRHIPRDALGPQRRLQIASFCQCGMLLLDQ